MPIQNLDSKIVHLCRIRRTKQLCPFILLPPFFQSAGFGLDGADARGRRVKVFWCSHFEES